MMTYLQALKVSVRSANLPASVSDGQVQLEVVLVVLTFFSALFGVAASYLDWRYWWIFTISGLACFFGILHVEAMVRVHESSIHRCTGDCS